MKRLFIILPLLSFIATSCYKEPVAEAVFTPDPAYVGQDVDFTNYSVNANRVQWDFGDGTISDAFNVTHYYVDPGTYTGSLSAYGKKGDVSVAPFQIQVIGSEIKIIVKDYEDDALIEGASVILFESLADWEAGNYKGKPEAFTDAYGECTFSNLSYQKYYVDVQYREQNADTGWVNWLLAEEDIKWIETQMLPGNYDHTFIAYVDFVTFDDNKKSARFGMRPEFRPPLNSLRSKLKSASSERALKENKISTKRGEK